MLASRFDEADVELLLLALTHAGFALRSDDPSSLRDVLRAVQSHVTAAPHLAPTTSSGGKQAPAESTSTLTALASRFTEVSAATQLPAPQPSISRIAVMGELLLDLKNNRKRADVEQLLERGAALRKWVSRLASRTPGAAEGATERVVRASWSDIVAIPERGRWWLVGASWAGRAAAGASSAAASAIRLPGASVTAVGGDASTAGYTEAERRLLDVAVSMRMNTVHRRSAFVALMGADDADDALERLLRLGLRGAAEREIVRVLLDCAGQEAAYNPFYAAVGAGLCAYHPRFKFTFQLAFWDIFKTLDSGTTTTSRRVYNLARLLAALIGGFALSIAVLKPLDFVRAGRLSALFIKAVMTAVLLDVRDTADSTALFSRLGAPPDRTTLRDGLLVFMHAHVSVAGLVTASRARGNAMDASDLRDRLRAARRGLESVTGTVEEELLS